MSTENPIYIKVILRMKYDNGAPMSPDSFCRRNANRVFPVLFQDEDQIVVQGSYFGRVEEGISFQFVDAKEFVEPYIHLSLIRDKAAIVDTPTGKAVVTAHRSSGDIFQLVGGRSLSMHHIEYSFHCFKDGQLRIYETRVNNNHTRTNSSSQPYKAENYPTEYHDLFAELIAEAKASPK